MDLQALRIFLAVAEERSFSRAAAKVHRTQPAVSQAVRRLENDLGEELFDRSSKSGTLTDAGLVLSPGALVIVAMVPVIDITSAVSEVQFAKANGACGVFMRPLEGTRQITDPYFFPLYEEAQKIDFCIGLHQSNGSAAAVDMMVNPDGSRDFFNQYRIFNVGALFRIINCGIPSLFPKLRFGFIETAASWVPWVVYELHRRLDKVGNRLPDDLLERCGIRAGDMERLAERGGLFDAGLAAKVLGNRRETLAAHRISYELLACDHLLGGALR